ncbi:MAG: Cullin-4 [Cyphobasidiales sp. Tagirdzhanova-0007]|nr:MAG: Cullin-4 [Cyphobasidiales sp. Tagirdzhanova-0007]
MSTTFSPHQHNAMSSPSSPHGSSSLAGATHASKNRISLASSLRPAAAIISTGPKKASRNAVTSPSADSSAPAADGRAVKKLHIKNLRPRSAASSGTEFTAHALQTLTRAVRAILSTPPEPTPESLQALYTLCEGLVGASSGDVSKNSTAQTLYDRIRIEVERKVGETAHSLNILDTANGETWLAEIQKIWTTFNEKMLLIRSIFLHLDRTFVLHTTSLLSLWDMGLDIFRHRIVEDTQIGSRISREMIKLVNRDRDGQTVSSTLLTGLISLLTAVSPASHTTVFVTPFLSSSTAYYQLESQKLLSISSPSAAEVQEDTPTAKQMEVWDYMTHIKKRLSEEGERCDQVIGQDVKGGVLRVVEETQQQRTEDLAILYSLFARVSALTELKNAFHSFVKAKGTSIVSDASRDETMVDSLIAFQTSLDVTVTQSFGNDFDFSKATKDAFVLFINSRQNKPAEMIAKFIDAKMRAGNRAMADEELEKTFRSVLTLFRYCQGKDIFEAFYKKDFAKRLLLNRSASSDAEKSMLLKLKEECGPAFTAKLETMAKDIDLASCFVFVSADIMKAFKEHLGPDGSNLLTVNVLTTGNWPTYHRTPCRIPDSLSRELDRFTRFYKVKYAGRSLAYMHALDQCTLRAEFSKGPGGGRKELNVSFYQAIILLLFNDIGEEEKIGFKEIVEQTGLEPKETVRTLQSLACAKHKVLLKEPKGRDVSESDEFSFNPNFKDDKYRLKINQIQQKETVEEQKSTTQQVLLDRQSHLQLVIVRILKSRKSIKHTELIMEVVNMLKERFRVDPPEIKKAIDSLIDRDYMERNGRDAYNYLA